MKKTDNQKEEAFDQKSSNSNKKNSLFDDSFFDDEDDDEDEDFDFDDEDDMEEEEEEHDENLPHDAPMAAPNPSAPSQSVVEKPAQQENLPASNQSSEINRTQDIQFRLGCELGQILIPYDNLQNLNIGSVVDFNNTLQTLYLSVNNVRVGEGMLVDVDGKIGIKITRWHGKV